MTSRSRLTCATLASACFCTTAPAQLPQGVETTPAVDPGPRSSWERSLGAALIVVPRFVGSDRTRVLVVPSFELRYDDWFFVDPIKGVGVEAKPVDGLTATAAVALDLASRRSKDDSRLRGFRNIEEAPALRFGLAYTAGDAFVDAGFATRVGKHDGRGTLFETDLGYNIVTSKRALVAVGLNLKGMDRTYARHFFDVTREESAVSGLRAYRAKAGLQSIGPFVQAVVPISDRWTLFGRASVTRLHGAAADSPITVRRRQALAISTISYAF